MSVTLKFTYQPSKSLPEANKQINEFVELVKSQLLGVATKEELDGVQVEVEENIKESTKGFAGVRTKATDAESKVDMIASFNQATAQITLKAAMVNGIERSNITLSGDQILLNGDTTIGSGFVLTADNIAAGAITANKIATNALGGFSVETTRIIGHGLGEVTVEDRDADRRTTLWAEGVWARKYSTSRGSYLQKDGIFYKNELGTKVVGIGLDANGYGSIQAERGYFGKLQVDDTETTTSYDAALTTNGYIRRKGGSSKRFKNSISYELSEDMNPEKLYDVSIVSFKYNKDYLSKDDQRYDKHLIGFIAEDIDVHYPQACDYDDEGRPSGWNTHYIIPAMLKLIQDQHKEIEELKDAAVKRDSKIKELEAQVAEVSELVKELLQE